MVGRKYYSTIHAACLERVDLRLDLYTLSVQETFMKTPGLALTLQR